jgi:hypothetical protein
VTLPESGHQIGLIKTLENQCQSPVDESRVIGNFRAEVADSPTFGESQTGMRIKPDNSSED